MITGFKPLQLYSSGRMNRLMWPPLVSGTDEENEYIFFIRATIFNRNHLPGCGFSTGLHRMPVKNSLFNTFGVDGKTCHVS